MHSISFGLVNFNIFEKLQKLKVKPSSEQSFLYGNHILKSGLGRITEGAAQYQGVVVYNMNDVPLGKKIKKIF